MPPLLIGIDLGTTNSLCAVFRDGEPELIPGAHGRFLTPSCVGILETGEIVVGEAALELSITHPQRCASWFKRAMGTDKRFDLAGKEFTAQELSSLVLRSLLADAETHLGSKVEKAVITVPAYFNDHQRQATRIAAQLAGLSAQRIVNEPTAAALTYGLADREADRKLLVFDLGGGTFDVTLMESCDGVLEIVATAGESHLGGEDFTDRIADWALSSIGETLEVSELQAPLRVARLRSQAEAAKRALGEHDRTTLKMPSTEGCTDETAKEIELTRELLAEVSAPLLQRLDGPIGRVLRDGRCELDELDEVILVGGATRMPLIREFVERRLRREPSCSLDPDEVVARGAAIQAALIEDDRSVEDLVMTDVCPFTLGVEVTKEFGSRQKDGYFMPVIHRNTTIPVSKEETVSTLHAGQRIIKVRVFQGESRRVEENLLLGEFEVSGIPARERGAPVTLRFTYDMNGLLEVEAIIEETGKKFRSLFTQHVRNLSETEIELAAARLRTLKFYPRENANHQKLLQFGARIVGEIGTYQREGLEQAIDFFENELNGNDREGFQQARQDLLLLLSQLGHPFEESSATPGDHDGNQ